MICINAGCSLDEIFSSTELTTAAFAGRVLEQRYKYPLVSARVVLQGKIAFTNAYGLFRIADVKTGEWPVEITLAGYQPYAETVTVVIDDNVVDLMVKRNNLPPVIRQMKPSPLAPEAGVDSVRLYIELQDSTGPVHRARIDWGDGVSSSFSCSTDLVTRNHSHLYLRPDTFAALLVAFDSAGDSSSHIKTIDVRNKPPAISIFRSDKDSLEATIDTAIFSFQAADYSGIIQRISLDFGDDSIVVFACSANAFTNTSKHVYRGPGNYNARLVVTDSYGDSSEKTCTVVARNRPPSASLLVLQDTVYAKTQRAQLVISALDGDTPLGKWKLQFGDGSFDSQVVAGHSLLDTLDDYSFEQIGKMQVILTVMDSLGGIALDSAQIVIRNHLPQIQRHAPSPESARAGLDTIRFRIQAHDSNNAIDSAILHFGNGKTATIPGDTSANMDTTYPYEYDLPGSYGPHIVVFDRSGDSSESALDSVHIQNGAPVQVSYSAVPGTTKAIEDSVVFTFAFEDPSGPFGKAWIEYGDGKSDTTKLWQTRHASGRFAHAYDTSGTFPVALKVSDAAGNVAARSDTVVIPQNHRPRIEITFSDPYFWLGEDGKIRVSIADPDMNVAQTFVNWGVGADEPFVGFWASHSYGSARTYTCKVTVVDRFGSSHSDSTQITAHRKNLPVFSRITFEPRSVSAAVSEVTLIANVILSGTYMDKIDWILNENDFPNRNFYDTSYTSATGTMEANENGKFKMTIPASDLKMGANTVKAIIYDAWGQRKEREETLMRY